jgi:putative toxin-antitoxin system antitoxin component (TIGR02293 family)
MSTPIKTESAIRRAKPKAAAWRRTTAAAPKVEPAKPEAIGYYVFYKAEPLERIRILKRGVLASLAKKIVADLAMPAAQTYRALDVPISTINRKAKTQAVLSQDEGERVLGLAKLVGQVEAMVEGADDAEGFDARAWTARWLSEPLPALGGARPLDFMDTMEGQALVSDSLARIQSGAYG